jgi:hypothetical protein
MSIAGCHGHEFWDSRRLWSLWDMVSGTLGEFVKAIAELDDVRRRVQAAADANPETIPDRATMAQYWSDMLLLRHFVHKLGMRRAAERLGRVAAFLSAGDPVTLRQWVHELYEVHEAVRYDSLQEGFCHYPSDRVTYLQRMMTEWASVFDKFGSARKDIEEGVDCYALGHNTACVFHMCRVSEIGLLAVGRERGVMAVRGGRVPIEWGTWGQIFEAVEPHIERINQWSNGPGKEAALGFYNTLLADLRAIKALYRDPTMHLREAYNDGEAQGAMFRARSLMTVLATKLSDQTSAEIPESAWP